MQCSGLNPSSFKSCWSFSASRCTRRCASCPMVYSISHWELSQTEMGTSPHNEGALNHVNWPLKGA